jgi:hypothetical protein
VCQEKEAVVAIEKALGMAPKRKERKNFVMLRGYQPNIYRFGNMAGVFSGKLGEYG